MRPTWCKIDHDDMLLLWCACSCWAASSRELARGGTGGSLKHGGTKVRAANLASRNVQRSLHDERTRARMSVKRFNNSSPDAAVEGGWLLFVRLCRHTKASQPPLPLSGSVAVDSHVQSRAK